MRRPAAPARGICRSGRDKPAHARYHSCIVRYHLNESLPEPHIGGWLSATAHLDLGVGQDGYPVLQTIINRAPATLLLSGISYLIAELIGLPLGIFAALRRYSFFDSVFTVLSYVGISMPSFWLGALFITFFAVELGWLPTGKIVQDVNHIPDFNGPGYWNYVIHNPWHSFTDFGISLILPGAVLAILTIAGDSRFMRASMLEVINQDYIRTARAKGAWQTRGNRETRTAQCPDADHHQCGARSAAIDRRRDHYRDHLRVARYGAVVFPRAFEQRLSNYTGAVDVVCGRRVGREHLW